MNATEPTRVCPHCHTQSQTAGATCPNCGKKFKKRGLLGKLLIAAVVFVVVMSVLIGGCTALLAGGVNEAVKESEKRKARTVQGAVGDDIENAGLTYKVASARTTNRVGDATFGESAEAGATFVVVDVVLTNEKDETKTFLDSSAKVRADGKSYATASEATVALGDASLILKDVQPGIPTHGSLVFMVPKGALADASLVVEDLYGDGKIEVDLGLGG